MGLRAQPEKDFCGISGRLSQEQVEEKSEGNKTDRGQNFGRKVTGAGDKTTSVEDCNQPADQKQHGDL
jgi:hypothetical protein